jgi:hypothetical protein
VSRLLIYFQPRFNLFVFGRVVIGKYDLNLWKFLPKYTFTHQCAKCECASSDKYYSIDVCDLRVFCMGNLVAPLTGSERNGFYFIDYPPRLFTRSSKFLTSQTLTWPSEPHVFRRFSHVTVNTTYRSIQKMLFRL